MMKRGARMVVWSLLAVVVVLLSAWTVVGCATLKDIEEPAYSVVREADGYEVREYKPYIVAEVTLPGGYRKTLYGGFRQVADYIFGNNTKSSDIAMTAPVLHRQEGQSEKIPMTAPVLHRQEETSEEYTLAFVMPAEYTMETLPKPNNEAVKLREVAARKMAVLKYSWYATRGRANRKATKLLERLERDGIAPTGPPATAHYNPPWTPPFMRRNEAQVEVDLE